MNHSKSRRAWRAGLLIILAGFVFLSEKGFAQTQYEIDRFFELIQANDTNIVFKALDENPNLVRSSYYGRRPLHVAAQKGRVEIVAKLLKSGADINEENDSLDTSNTRLTALDIAIWYDHPDVCRLLLESGANPNLLGYHDGSALRVAFMHNGPEMAGWLLDHGANPFLENASPYNHATPMDEAIARSDGKLVPRMLNLRSKFSATDLRTNNVPPTSFASSPRQSKGAAEIFAERGADWLATAAQRGELEAVEAIFDAGVTISNAVDRLTVMQAFSIAAFAAQNSRPGAEQQLRQVQDELKSDYIAKADKNFVDSLRSREKNAEAELASLAPERWQKILDLLVKHGAHYDALAATVLNDTNQIMRLLFPQKNPAQVRDFFGNTPLHWAVQYNRLSLVSPWLQAGTPLGATNSAGQTALHLAATAGKMDFVKVLLAANAPTGVRDTNGWTPLDAAMQAKQADVIHVLMADQSASAYPGRGSATALHKAAAAGNIAALVALVETETNLEARNELGLTPLHVAGQAGQLGAAAVLIDQGADVNARDPEGNTVLHQILLSRTHWVKGRPSDAWVERRKKNPSQEKFWRVYNTPSGYTSPRELAASVAFFLACGADSAAINHAGQTILQLVTADSTMLWDYDRAAILPLLQQSGNGLNERDADGNTALHRLANAVDANEVDRMKSLIAAGADVNATNNLGQTPLHKAAEKIWGWDLNEDGDNEPFQLLVKSKANVNARDNQGRTPLDVLAAADTSSKAEATALLIKAGAKTSGRDKLGRTPAHMALTGEWPWRSAGENLQKLVEAGADLSAKDDEGKTPLHYLAALGSQSPMFFIQGVGDTFIAAKVNFNGRDNDGNTPLMIAVKTGTTDVLEWLVKQGADLDATNNVGQTPRMLALKDGNQPAGLGRGMTSLSAELDIFQAIREGKDNSAEQILNANPQLANTPDRTGQTPLRVAVMFNRTNIVSLLEARGVMWDAPSAVMAGRGDLVKKILKQQPATITESANGESLLHLAAISGNVDIIQQLLVAGADLQAVDSFGLSPLGRARLKSQTEAVNILVARAARNNYFDAIYLNDAQSVSQYLLQNKSLANATNQAKVAPVEIAAAAGYSEVLQSLLNAGGRADALPLPARTNSPAAFAFNRSMSSMAPYNWTTTPLNLAVFHNQTNAVEILLRAGADVNQPDSHGFAPLHFAVLRNNLHALSLLLQHGANPDAASAQLFSRPRMPMPGPPGFPMPPAESQSSIGEAPLHLAAMLGETNVIALLLKAGAAVNVTNRSARTPLDEAEMTGRSFRMSITPPAMLKPLEPLGLFQEQVYVSSASPENLKGAATMIVAGGGQHGPAFKSERARLSSAPFTPTGRQISALADGREYHITGCNHFDSHNFTNALADFRKSAELGSDVQDYTYYRIWIIRSRLGEKAEATSQLAAYLGQRKAQNPGDWPLQVGRFLAGQSTEGDFLASAENANPQTAKEQHCEAYFYIGSKHLIDEDKTGAIENFKKCQVTNLPDFEEYQSASSELIFLKTPAANPP